MARTISPLFASDYPPPEQVATPPPPAPGSPPLELQATVAWAMAHLIPRTPKQEPTTPTQAGPANPHSPTSSTRPKPSLEHDVTNLSFITSSTASSVSTPLSLSSHAYSTPPNACYAYITPLPDSLHGPTPPPAYFPLPTC